MPTKLRAMIIHIGGQELSADTGPNPTVTGASGAVVVLTVRERRENRRMRLVSGLSALALSTGGCTEVGVGSSGGASDSSDP